MPMRRRVRQTSSSGCGVKTNDSDRRNAEQKKRIADLERQLALRQQNSTTTSKPPSSDGLAGRQRERGRRITSRRKPVDNRDIPGIRGRWCRPNV